jgi:tRNA-splicing ligase RtcB (3'-phosphate/5'-hydroxy nucleic acid ligase)
MKTHKLTKLGIPKGPAIELARQAARDYARTEHSGRVPIIDILTELVAQPEQFEGHDVFGKLAQQLIRLKQAKASYQERAVPASYAQWGTGLEAQSVQQMENACRLPISVVGALMPDAHTGYGLPIGGVLATRNTVIPYAVGVDIACRMKMTVLDLPVSTIQDDTSRLRKAIEKETRFGVGAGFKTKRQHAVMDQDWSFSTSMKINKDKAWQQLGSSGSGNHFVEFGTVRLSEPDLGLAAGTYLALLSHSGSRGTGNLIATHYSKLAAELHPELPDELVHLAWLDLDSDIGQEYWQAMTLMGDYASANHELIHRHIAEHLGVDVRLDIENHHNFAWKEEHSGEELIVHRKGATPAGDGAIGIIPGSMGTPGYVVRGKGNALSLNSASHGAGRRMSRTAAKKQFTWSDITDFLAERGIILMSAGLDEIPMAYKDIDEVMAAQDDLVDTIARFDPKLVKMAPAGERPED